MKKILSALVLSVVVFANDALSENSFPAEAQVCPIQTVVVSADKEKIVKCLRFFSKPPFVRPPEDQRTPEADILYASYIAEGQDWTGRFNHRFVDRNGIVYRPVNSEGQLLSERELPSTMGMPTYRNMIYIYQVFGRIRNRNSTDRFFDVELKDVKPVILLDGCALDGLALGEWEGKVSRRISEDRFDANHVVPFQFEFTEMKSARNLKDWGSVELPDANAFLLKGKIKNYAKFKRMNEANPFFGSKGGLVEFYRFPGMHGAMDRTSVIEWTLKTGDKEGGMVPMMLTSSWAALLNAPLVEFSEFVYHGMPNGFFMTIRPMALGLMAPKCAHK